MDEREDIIYQFFQELIENYRQKIMEQDEVKELLEKQIRLSNKVRSSLNEPHPEIYRAVQDLGGCIYDISAIKQEQMYIQGVKDGIRMKNLVEKIEKGEQC